MGSGGQYTASDSSWDPATTASSTAHNRTVWHDRLQRHRAHTRQQRQVGRSTGSSSGSVHLRRSNYHQCHERCWEHSRREPNKTATHKGSRRVLTPTTQAPTLGTAGLAWSKSRTQQRPVGEHSGRGWGLSAWHRAHSPATGRGQGRRRAAGGAGWWPSWAASTSATVCSVARRDIATISSRWAVLVARVLSIA